MFIIAALIAAAVAAPSSYKSYEKTYEKDYKYPEIIVTGQPDERNVDGSGKWSYAQSDYTTLEEAQEQKKFTAAQTWAADNAGFQPKGDHLLVAPVHVYELPVAPVHEYELPVDPVPEYELLFARVHIPFNGKGFKIY